MAKTNKSKKDKITGLELSLDGIGKIQSDNLYRSADSTFLSGFISNGATQGASPQDWELEVELGKNFIVISQRSSENGATFINRSVFSGSFSYKKGRLSSALITGMGEHNFELGTEQDSEWAATYKISAGGKVSKVHDWGAWRRVLLGRTEESYARISQYPEGDITQIQGFGNGNLFQSGWETNPFAPNLI